MIIPQPQHLVRREGSFPLTDAITVYADQDAQLAAEAVRRDLGPATGFTFPPAGQDSAGIVLCVDPGRLPAEAYILEASPRQLEITGGDAAGAFYGVQALRQLLPPEIFSARRVERTWDIPTVVIEDRPRCGWRGMMLDVARHFFPVEFVLRLIDLLALHRLNVLHLHLTDDQGWRIEIPAYPKLTEIGAWRAETRVGHERSPHPLRPFDGTPHGGFYTQEELRQIVAYAADRFITVVPEIDMPGHLQSAIAAYPELGNTGEPTEVRTRWGISTQILNVDDVALTFCRDVLSEVVQLFPSTFIHCGGDEVPKDEWRASPRAQARIRELGLAGEAELQAWFTRSMADFLAEHGRRFLGWDEILEGSGPKALRDDTVVMSWRGEQGGITAAQAGLDAVMAPSTHLYFDHYQSEHTDTEPLAIGKCSTCEKVHAYDPIPAELRLDTDASQPTRRQPQNQHILGAQCQLWTEYIATPGHADYMLFPRLCAFAETVWRERADSYDEFLTRLRPHLARLDVLGVHYRP